MDPIGAEFDADLIDILLYIFVCVNMLLLI